MMNKNITQLWEQAAQRDDIMNTERHEKFAELIVQECADVLLKWKQEPFPFDEDLAVSLIKEHFGVEE